MCVLHLYRYVSAPPPPNSAGDRQRRQSAGPQLDGRVGAAASAATPGYGGVSNLWLGIVSGDVVVGFALFTTTLCSQNTRN
jgi:hypothetical protein